MQKINKILFITLLAFGMNSCSKEDPEIVPVPIIEGRWIDGAYQFVDKWKVYGPAGGDTGEVSGTFKIISDTANPDCDTCYRFDDGFYKWNLVLRVKDYTFYGVPCQYPCFMNGEFYGFNGNPATDSIKFTYRYGGLGGGRRGSVKAVRIH